jgi:hypothetical protein
MRLSTVLMSAAILFLGLGVARFLSESESGALNERLAPSEPAAVTPPPLGVLYCRPWLDAEAPGRALAAGEQPTTLPLDVTGEPSRALHGGRRWFLSVREVSGRRYSNGAVRREVFATHDDGLTVQLTDRPDLEPAPDTPLRWPIHTHDAQISWIGRRWTGGKVSEGGIYTARIAFDEKGLAAGLQDQSDTPAIAFSLTQARGSGEWSDAPVPDVCSYDWSPDGQSVVYESVDGEIFVRDTRTASARLLSSERACDPVWSPDGSRIAFKCCRLFGPIVTVRPDGSDARILVSPRADELFTVACPVWSPDGKYIAYQRAVSPDSGALSLDVDVYVTSAEGDGHRNLTGDTREGTRALAWR